MSETESLAVLPAPRRGAKPGNKNAVGHGATLRGNGNAIKSGLNSSNWPRGCADLEAKVTTLVNQIESEVSARNSGEISLYHAALIQSIGRHEQRCQLLTRWLRVNFKNLTIDDKTKILRDLGRATADRDTCMKELGLDRKLEADDWSSLREEGLKTDEHEAESPRADDESPGVSGFPAD